ncbi:hypothetical protein HK100_003717 [Physocladia obscura]|uniref:Uncharacterized protein n=1 Tax=Physocladia obscura TaxID=109957 RepID=A0AAD5XFW8_9FUNG|nr:hypothetical protein HK100_003717 [Physocladia obscura]
MAAASVLEQWNFDAETGLRRVRNVLVREPHFDTLAADDRRDSGVNLQDAMKRKLSSTDNEQSDLLLDSAKHSASTSLPQPPPPPPPIVPAVPVPPAFRRTTLKPKNNPKKRSYVVGVPFEVYYRTEAVDEGCLEPPPVFGLDGRATHLYFVVADWDVMWAGLSDMVKDSHEAAVVEMMEETCRTREQIEAQGSDCSGNTFQQGNFWYSTKCLYSKKINIATAGKDAGRGSGLSSQCRGCLATPTPSTTCFDKLLTLKWRFEKVHPT